MTLHEELEQVFAEVFATDVALTAQTTADDVEGWDSVANIALIFTIEQRFGVQFTDAELGGFANVGDLERSLERKTSRAS